MRRKYGTSVLLAALAGVLSACGSSSAPQQADEPGSKTPSTWTCSTRICRRTADRCANPKAVQEVFERILRLNPNDNQGVRFCWYDVCEGWSRDKASEHDSGQFR